MRGLRQVEWFMGDAVYLSRRNCRLVAQKGGTPYMLAHREDLFKSPQHPYTNALINAIPIPDLTINVRRLKLHGNPYAMYELIHLQGLLYDIQIHMLHLMPRLKALFWLSNYTYDVFACMHSLDEAKRERVQQGTCKTNGCYHNYI